MGSPMTWTRLLERNMLKGNYTRTQSPYLPHDPIQSGLYLQGDLRRLEQDAVQVEGTAARWLAMKAGVSPLTVVKVMQAFFDGAPKIPPHDLPVPQGPLPASLAQIAGGILDS